MAFRYRTNRGVEGISPFLLRSGLAWLALVLQSQAAWAVYKHSPGRLLQVPQEEPAHRLGLFGSGGVLREVLRGGRSHGWQAGKRSRPQRGQAAGGPLVRGQPATGAPASGNGFETAARLGTELLEVNLTVCDASALHSTGSEVQAWSARAKNCTQSERLLFLHIPKNAGSAIEEAAVSRGVHWGKYMDLQDCDLGSNSCWARWHEPPALMSAINVYTEAKVFCIVRNPFERVVSEYKYIVAKPEFRWGHNGLIEREGCSSTGLNAWVASVLDSYNAGNIFEQLCHLLPQSYYIWGPPDSWGNQCQYCNEIIRQEDLPTAFNDLMQRYNYSVRLGEHVNEGACPDLSIRNLSATSVEALRTVYEQDFHRLNYSTEVPAE